MIIFILDSSADYYFIHCQKISKENGIVMFLHETWLQLRKNLFKKSALMQHPVWFVKTLNNSNY